MRGCRGQFNMDHTHYIMIKRDRKNEKNLKFVIDIDNGTDKFISYYHIIISSSFTQERTRGIIA
jgi:hypothetical protein